MEKKKIIYDALIQSGGVTLTTKELNQLGIPSSEITKLIKDKVIAREKRGIYTLASLEDVIDYGYELIRQKRKQEANILFDICYQVGPNNLSVAFQKMNGLVCSESYEEAYMIFEELCQKNYLSEKDKVVFFHLFYSLRINKEQTEKETLNKEYYFIKKANRNDSIENQIISCLLNNDFASVQTLISYHKENKTIQDRLILNMVIKIHVEKIEKQKRIQQFIHEKKYTEAKAEIDKDSTFNLKDKTAFKRILDDKVVVESGRTIKLTDKNANSFYQAVETKNYALVHDFIKKEKKFSMYEELVNDILKGNTKNKEVKFSDIMEVLMQGNMESCISLLDKYLMLNGKEQYKDLVIDYIKASILEEDLAYSKPMILLTQLNTNTYFFDLSNILQDFYKSLSINNKVLSKVYLDIITDANKLGLSNMNIKNLYVAIHNIKENKIKEELMQKINYINTLINKKDGEKVLIKDNVTSNLIPIFNEELAPIFDLIISDQKLTLKTLENLGIDKEKIENLVEEKVLKKVRRYEYALASTDQLQNYRKYLTEKEEYDKADKCAMKCFEIDPENERNIKQAFYISLKQDNLIKAYEIFNQISEKELFPKQNLNCWLYLFDNIVSLTDKDKNTLTHLKKEDFYFFDEKEENQEVTFENDIIKLILKGKNFPKAARLLKQDRSNFNHRVTENLLQKIMIKNKNQLSLLEELVNRKEYETIFTELSNKNIENSVFKKRVLKIVGDILELKENKMVSNIRLESDKPLDIAIMQKKYSDALMNLSLSVTDDEKMNKRNGILKNLLTDMVCLMDEAKEKNDNEEDTNNEENVFSIDTLVMLLNDRNISKALEEIENYLKISNKSEYRYLILDLLKLDILNQDTTFERTMTELSRIKGADYVFDIDAILPDFYNALGDKNFLEARIYLDMIKNNEEYKEEKDFINQLTSIVDNAQNDSTYQTTYHINNNFLELFKDVSLSNQILTTQESIKIEPEIRKKEDIAIYLEKQIEKLKENDGIILLDQKYVKCKSQIQYIMKDKKEVDIFGYGKDSTERILLRKRKGNNINWKELKEQAKDAYARKDYEKSIELNKEILQTAPEIKPYVLFSIGLSYMKTKKMDKAIKFIKIADDMTYAEKLEYHYTELLDKLTMDDFSETKEKVEMGILEFNDNNNTYGIKNIEEVSTLISQVGIPVLEACEKLGFDQEKTNIVTLLCARDCFIDQNDELGNKYLKMVEKTPNKTEKVKEVFQEITSNKKFYKNRSQEKQMILKSKIVGNIS